MAFIIDFPIVLPKHDHDYRVVYPFVCRFDFIFQ
jgi:hypothetical protein